MVAVQIRDVPDETRDALVRLAQRKGQSLQSFLLEELTELARRGRQGEAFDRLTALGGGSRLTETGARDLRDRERAERDGESVGP